MSTTDTAAESARVTLRSAEGEGRGVEELPDEMDPGAEAILQERLVKLGKQRGIGLTVSRRPSVEGAKPER
jgi:hypothetical protein